MITHVRSTHMYLRIAAIEIALLGSSVCTLAQDDQTKRAPSAAEEQPFQQIGQPFEQIGQTFQQIGQKGTLAEREIFTRLKAAPKTAERPVRSSRVEREIFTRLKAAPQAAERPVPSSRVEREIP